MSYISYISMIYSIFWCLSNKARVCAQSNVKLSIQSIITRNDYQMTCMLELHVPLDTSWFTTKIPIYNTSWACCKPKSFCLSSKLLWNIYYFKSRFQYKDWQGSFRSVLESIQKLKGQNKEWPTDHRKRHGPITKCSHLVLIILKKTINEDIWPNLF